MRTVFANLTFIGILFAVWARHDYVYVTVGTEAWWAAPVYWSILLMCFAVNVYLYTAVLWRRIALALATCVADCLAVLALVLTLGIQYHFSIGGQL